MKKILIDKQIGADFFEDGITADFIRRELESAKEGEEIQLVMDSPGGYVWDCIAIYNVIRDYCRNHTNRVNVYIQGIAMSCASVIAMAAKSVNKENSITVEDNSIFMIHNAWGLVTGNENDLRRAAEDLSKIDGVIASTYKSVTGKSEKELRKMMDDETYLYGVEIVENGFADTVIAGEESPIPLAFRKTERMACAKNKWEDTKKVMEKASGIAAQKIAAMATQFQTNKGTNKDTNKTEGCMTAEEFKTAHPQEAQKLFAEGVKSERERCTAHLKMGEIANSLETSAKFIRDGVGIAESEVQTTYFEARVKNAAKNEREQDNVPPITTPAESKDAGIKEALAAFDARIGGAR